MRHHRYITLCITAAFAVLLLATNSRAADEAANVPDKGFEPTPLVSMVMFTPEEMDTRPEQTAGHDHHYVPVLLPSELTMQYVQYNTKRTPSIVTGVSYTMFGQVANIPSADVRIHAEGANYYTLVGVMGFNVSYARQEYKLVGHSAGTTTAVDQTANVIAYEWAPNVRLLDLPMNGGVAVGTVMYEDDNRFDEVNFSQPYAAYTFRHGNRISGRIGANWIRGDLEHKSGAFSTLVYSVGDELSLYADYNTKNFQKLVFNHVILPIAGVDCSSCRDDALSVGMAFKVGNIGHANIGFFDVNDMMAPMGSLSIKKKF